MDEFAYTPIFGRVYQIAKSMSEHEALALLMACCAYVYGEDMPEMEPLTQSIFENVAKPSIDASMEKAARNRANAAKRNKKKESVPTTEPHQSEIEATSERHVSETEPIESDLQADVSETVATRTMKNEERRMMYEEPLTNVRGECEGGRPPKPPRKKFVKPSLEEVAEYGKQRCLEVGIPPGSFSAQRFIDHYESNGWKVGKNPMKDWKASVRTWISNEKDGTYRAPHPKIASERDPNRSNLYRTLEAVTANARVV